MTHRLREIVEAYRLRPYVPSTAAFVADHNGHGVWNSNHRPWSRRHAMPDKDLRPENKEDDPASEFLRAFGETLLDLGADEEGVPLSNTYSFDDIPAHILRRWETECLRFTEKASDLLQGRSLLGGQAFAATRGKNKVAGFDSANAKRIWGKVAASDLYRISRTYSSLRLELNDGIINVVEE
jgi:hypothetical protein